MTTDSHSHDLADTTGPSIHTVRARKLLLAGFSGGMVATVASLLCFGLIYGRSGVLSAGLAAAMVLFFYAGGQYVMVRFADAGARTLLMVSMMSYTARIVILGLVLLAYDQYQSAWPLLHPMAIFITTIAIVVGWLTTEVVVFSRLRIGAYDLEYQSPSSPDVAQ